MHASTFQMNIPFFYAPDLAASGEYHTLDDVSRRHLVQVLRGKPGDTVILTDGKGARCQGIIAVADKKNCTVTLTETRRLPTPSPVLAIAISFTKNLSRMEWFLEKATEIGIREIHPLVCHRTEKTRYNASRMQKLLVAAMLQSRQAYLPILHEPASFQELAGVSAYPQRFIAHCEPGEKSFFEAELARDKDTLILIGPEGDFTPGEIALAKENGYSAVSLGPNRLRTETAGVVAATLMMAVNER